MFAAFIPVSSRADALPIVRFHTTFGDIDCQLRPDVAPKNVSNFLAYVDGNYYTNNLIHRSVPGFIIQGGGYDVLGGNIVAIPTGPPVTNEFSLSNKRGTLAMAKLPGDPNSATSQWFFNESDNNAASLDTQNGGYTVIGQVTPATIGVMDAIAAVPVPTPPPIGPPLDQMPLRNYTQGNPVSTTNMVFALSIVRILSPPQISMTVTGTNIAILVNSFSRHTYQLQGSSQPVSGTFTNVATPQNGVTGTTLTFTATTMSGTNGFYRVAISP
jgi:cyclophilin family peptidyl-prolyl cis-trans isomerase